MDSEATQVMSNMPYMNTLPSTKSRHTLLLVVGCLHTQVRRPCMCWGLSFVGHVKAQPLPESSKRPTPSMCKHTGTFFGEACSAFAAGSFQATARANRQHREVKSSFPHSPELGGRGKRSKETGFGQVALFNMPHSTVAVGPNPDPLTPKAARWLGGRIHR